MENFLEEFNDSKPDDLEERGRYVNEAEAKKARFEELLAILTKDKKKEIKRKNN